MKKLDLIGKQFGKWKVVHNAGISSSGRLMWLCQCSCKRKSLVSGSSLKSGHSKSCGCCGAKIRITHGKSKTLIYRVWANMIYRCRNQNCKYYKDYGGRGITVCKRWINSFEAFETDMGPRPSSKHSLDRENNNRGYTTKNCRWATKEQQQNNRRKYSQWRKS